MVAKQGLPCHHPTYRGYGDPSYGLMRIGIAPGEVEIEKGRPFVGPTGELLRDITTAAGWDNTHTFDTNCICSWHNEPTPEQLDACKPRLLAEIEVFKPKLIVMYGADVPGRYLLGKGSKRGWIYNVNLSGGHQCYALWTYHPSAVLQGGNHLIYDIFRDTYKIPYVLGQPVGTWPPRMESYTLIDSPNRAQRVLNSFESGEIVALDIETRLHDPNTDDLDIYTDDLLCLSVSNGTRTFVFTRAACGSISIPLSWPMGVEWTYHNSPFDRAGLLKYLGIHLPVTHDTMYMSSGRDEYTGTTKFKRTGQNKLESLTAEYFADTQYKDVTKKSWRQHQEPNPQDLHARNANDAFYTWHLVPVLRRFHIQPAYESLVLPASQAYSEICLRGAYIDQTVKTALAKEWGTAHMKLYTQLVRKGIKNPGSSAQLSHYFYDPVTEGGLGLEGGPSTAKAVLREIDHPDARDVVRMRNIKYLLDHWIFALSDHIKPDGRVHPNIILHGPETGRRAAHNPPVQTIPKHGQQLERIRELFCATTSDYVIVEADYSQAEMWVAAYVSEDQALLKDLSTTPDGWSKPDVHLATAIRVGATELPISKDDARQAGKTLNFLMLYGGGAQKLADTLQSRGIPITLKDAETIVREYRAAYSGFSRWADKTWNEALHEGFLQTPFGRVRRFPLILDMSWRSQVINYPIQSIAGDYTLSSLVELNSLFKVHSLDAHILFDIHDSLVMEIHKKDLEEALLLVRKVMEAPRVGLGGINIDFKCGVHL